MTLPIENGELENVASRYMPNYPLWGITNGAGGFWTHQVFTSEEAARRYQNTYWRGDVPPRHEVIPVRLAIEDARDGRDSQ